MNKMSDNNHQTIFLLALVISYLILEISSGVYSEHNSPKIFSVPERNIDYTRGFLNGFTSGLPTFDFSTPMIESIKNAPSLLGSSGSAYGLPQGFPNLNFIGGNFLTNGNQHTIQPSQFLGGLSGQSYEFGSSSSPFKYYNEVHRSPPGSASYQYQSQFQDSRPLNQLHYPPSYKPNRHHINLRQKQLPSISIGNDFYTPHNSPLNNNEHVKSVNHHSRPIVLKVSTKKIRPTKLPPPTPPFYAPSPDLQVISEKGISQSYITNGGLYDESRIQHSQRSRRDVEKSIFAGLGNTTDQPLREGSQGNSLKSTPYILFDNYEVDKVSRSSEDDEDVAVDEQRFFPSFPISSPYGNLHPFLSSPPQPRPSLFPGPSSNRSPARSHHGFQTTKFQTQQQSPHPGSSGIYATESHDQSSDRYMDNNLLGSGNFEVVRGGTFYEEDEPFHHTFHNRPEGHSGGGSHSGDDGHDYYSHNGHSSGFRQPTSDFFANFRDFADINPHSRSFSHNYETKLSLDANGVATVQNPQSILDTIQITSSDHHSTLQQRDSVSHESDPMIATY